MTAAEVTLITRKEAGIAPGFEFVRVYVTTTADWFNSKIGNIQGVVGFGETTADVSAVWSGQKITITCTAAQYVNLIIWGTG